MADEVVRKLLCFLGFHSWFYKCDWTRSLPQFIGDYVVGYKDKNHRLYQCRYCLKMKLYKNTLDLIN
jgi:hypothetical protein